MSNKRFGIIGTQAIQTMRELCTSEMPDESETMEILDELSKTMVAFMDALDLEEYTSSFSSRKGTYKIDLHKTNKNKDE